LYIRLLQQNGLLKTAVSRPAPLDFGNYGSQEFIEKFVRMVAYGHDGNGSRVSSKGYLGGIVYAAENGAGGKRI